MWLVNSSQSSLYSIKWGIALVVTDYASISIFTLTIQSDPFPLTQPGGTWCRTKVSALQLLCKLYGHSSYPGVVSQGKGLLNYPELFPEDQDKVI